MTCGILNLSGNDDASHVNIFVIEHDEEGQKASVTCQ